MPRCKNCNEIITKFDKEICPYCGCKNPIDKDLTETCDVTQTIDTINDTNSDFSYKEHKKNVNFILCLFLGFLGIDAFYLGFKKEGILRIVANILLFAGLFLLFFFLLVKDNLLIAILIPVCCIVLIDIILSLFIRSKRKKDAKGVFLR